MVDYTVWMIEKANISVSGSGSLDGVTQGDGSHLVGRSLTLAPGNWLQTTIRDDDTSFEDNDSSQQTLVGSQTINGVTYADGTRVEAEYRIILTDPTTGEAWTAYAYNVNNSSPAYATVEGLMLRPNENGTFPPVDRPLTVTFASEGPSGLNSNLYDLYDSPPCFLPGTLILTAAGPRPIEMLTPGDLIMTRDNGPQPLRWISRTRVSRQQLADNPRLAPVCLAPGALGDGIPVRPLQLSPQHRILISGWRAELLFAETEVLVPAIAFLGDIAVRAALPDNGVEYLHLLFDRHEIILAEGAPVESLLPAWLTDRTLPPALQAELIALIARDPDTDDAGTARRCLSVQEGRVLTGRWCG